MLPGIMLASMNRESNELFEPATTVEHSPGPNDRSRPLLLSMALHEQIAVHLARSLPNEGCGLLAGVADGDAARAVHFFPGTNIDQSPVRYTMEPQEVIDALVRIRQEEWDLAAIVHSHPRSAPEPSRTDLREAYYPDARLIIVSFSGEVPEFGCWALTGDRETRAFRRAPLLFEQR